MGRVPQIGRFPQLGRFPIGQFRQIGTELRPLIDVRYWFSLSIFGISLPTFYKLCMRVDIRKECLWIVDGSILLNNYRVDVQNSVLPNIILTNGQILIFLFVTKCPVTGYVACLQRFYLNIGMKILSCLKQ